MRWPETAGLAYRLCAERAWRRQDQFVLTAAGGQQRPRGRGTVIGSERGGHRKTYARQLGLNVVDFSAHSLRSGFLTSAARRGASVLKIRDVWRHRSMDVLQAYVRDAELFRDHAGAGLL